MALPVRDMSRWMNRVALVTGASTGIGAAVASALVKYGVTVVGSSRQPQKIEELAKDVCALPVKGKLFAQKCDMSKAHDVMEMFKSIKEKHGGVDICVNSARVIRDAPILSGQIEHWREMLETNVLGLTICTREALKSMRERGVDEGYIINVNSLLGHRISSEDHNHFYAATKFAVKALTEGTRKELNDMESNIRITQISPWMAKAESQKQSVSAEESGAFVDSSKESALTPEVIADTVIYALSSPPGIQIDDLLVRPTRPTV